MFASRSADWLKHDRWPSRSSILVRIVTETEISERLTILGMPVDRIEPHQFVDHFIHRALEGHSGYVCVPNVHQCIEAFDDPVFAEIIRSADMVMSDSAVLHRFVEHKYGLPRLHVLRADRLTLAICQRAAAMKVPVALIGGKDEAVLARMVSELRRQCPGIDVRFSYSPPFGPVSAGDEQAMIEAIRVSGAQIVFIGLGCPKQERWMGRFEGRIPGMKIGVGAAFDFISGQVKTSPEWMHRSGFEWLHRLISEPRRLWRRYLGTSPRFIWLYATREWPRRA